MTTFLLTAGVLLVLFAAIELYLRLADVADPPSFNADPRFGFVMHPNQSVSTRGRRFWINNLGLRGPDVGPKQERERRIVFIGDSLAYGGGRVLESELFVTLIAKNVATIRGELVSSINVSVPGWGIQNMADFITARGLFEADVVVWTLSSPTFRRPKTLMHQFGFPSRRPRSRLLFVTRSWLRRPLSALRPATVPRQPPRTRHASDNIDALAASLQVVRSVAVPMVVVAVPGEMGYGRLASEVPRFQAAVEAHGAVFTDLTFAFKDTRRHESRLFTDGVHLSPDGHRVVAEAVLPLVASALASRLDSALTSLHKCRAASGRAAAGRSG